MESSLHRVSTFDPSPISHIKRQPSFDDFKFSLPFVHFALYGKKSQFGKTIMGALDVANLMREFSRGFCLYSTLKRLSKVYVSLLGK